MRLALTTLRIAATLVVAWQALVWIARPPAYILPPPLDVAAVFLRQPSFLLSNGFITLTEILAGFGLGAALGIATAVAIAALPRLGRLVWPLVLVLQAFPVFVLAPVLVLWFGFGLASKVVMTTIIITTPLLRPPRPWRKPAWHR